jgi:hypothetical protein
MEIVSIRPLHTFSIDVKVDNEVKNIKVSVDWTINRVWFDDSSFEGLEKVILERISPSYSSPLKGIPTEIKEKMNKIRSGEFKKELNTF